jgi:ATP-dependent Clp protease adaptor protein ClpS
MTPHESTQVETAEKVEHARLWNVIVWDDPINLMTYVVYVFQKIFGYSTHLATKLMKEVHESGKSLVATEEREQAELHVSQLHQYGLQATMERQEY